MQIALLEEKKSIKQLVEVDTNKSILEFIEKELKADEYNFIVTSDNLAFAKTKMADLNKSSKFIDTFRKTKVASESKDIDTFKDNVKKYVALIDDKREQIKKDVEVLEKETKESILKELSLYCEEFIKIQGIRDNFKDVDIIDLMVLGSVTAKGSLTKKARETIESRVNVCKSKQDKYDMRLMKLENLSHNAGLESPLTITHVQGIILLDDDEEYSFKVEGLISSEIDRQNTIKANVEKQARENAEREAQQKVINEQNRISDIFKSIATDSSLDIDSKIFGVSNYDCSHFGQFESFARDKAQMVISELNSFKKEMSKKEVPIVHETIPFTQDEKAQIVKENEDGKKVVYINVELQFKVKDSIHDSKIVGKVHKMLTDAGFVESLMSVQVVS